MRRGLSSDSPSTSYSCAPRVAQYTARPQRRGILREPSGEPDVRADTVSKPMRIYDQGRERLNRPAPFA